MPEFEWDNKTTPKSDTAPKRRARKRTQAFYKSQCSSLVAIGNVGLVITSPEDVLSDDEMDMLTDALVAECTASDRIANWLERAAGVSPHVLLIKAIGMIIIPRLQRRGIIPSFGDDVIGDKMTDEEKAEFIKTQLQHFNAEDVMQFTREETADSFGG